VVFRRRNKKEGCDGNLLPAGIISGRWLFKWEVIMNGVIYLVGLIVVVLAILSFFGLR